MTDKAKAVEDMKMPPPAENPKRAFGLRKVLMSVVPWAVIAELAIAMLEGALKYGRHNYRCVGSIRGSDYYDAGRRHMDRWWEGEDYDPDILARTGMKVSHVTKAIASLVVLRDAMICGTFEDDRPPATPAGFYDALDKMSAAMMDSVKVPVAPLTEKGRGQIWTAPQAPQPRPSEHPASAPTQR